MVKKKKKFNRRMGLVLSADQVVLLEKEQKRIYKKFGVGLSLSELIRMAIEDSYTPPSKMLEVR